MAIEAMAAADVSTLRNDADADMMDFSSIVKGRPHDERQHLWPGSNIGLQPPSPCAVS
jgi:hypothetical protein